MKIDNYKGFEINVNREMCLGGWEMVYYSVYRVSDGLELICNFREGCTVREVVKEMKELIDTPDELEDLLKSAEGCGDE